MEAHEFFHEKHAETYSGIYGDMEKQGFENMDEEQRNAFLLAHKQEYLQIGVLERIMKNLREEARKK